MWCNWEPTRWLHSTVCVFLTLKAMCTLWDLSPKWPTVYFDHKHWGCVDFALTHKHTNYSSFIYSLNTFRLPLSRHFLPLFPFSSSLLAPLRYLLFLSGRPSPWPRKVAMETEADLMQRREMNYTVRGSYVCVCVFAWLSAEECFLQVLIFYDYL